MHLGKKVSGVGGRVTGAQFTEAEWNSSFDVLGELVDSGTADLTWSHEGIGTKLYIEKDAQSCYFFTLHLKKFTEPE